MSIYKLSTIIVTYYTGDSLWRCISSLQAQRIKQKIIIVNNGNPPEVETKINALAGNGLEIISGHGNIGFGAACNLAFKHVESPYVLLCNPDCEIISNVDTLEKMVDKLADDNACWLAIGQILNSDYTEQKTCRRNLITPLTAMSEWLMLYKVSNILFPRINDYPPTTYVPAISGAFMLMLSVRYEQLGGMDERYFLHMEDMDLCMRVNKSGGKIMYYPSLQVVHYLSTSKVSNIFVEMHKAISFIKYLYAHFNSPLYNLLITPLVSVAVWIRFGIKALNSLFNIKTR
jgi:N-acetylglucosaminyl-diphospho-decaprenol L-rhamnosyltransferase